MCRQKKRSFLRLLEPVARRVTYTFLKRQQRYYSVSIKSEIGTQNDLTNAEHGSLRLEFSDSERLASCHRIRQDLLVRKLQHTAGRDSTG